MRFSLVKQSYQSVRWLIMSTEKDPFKAYCDHIKEESSTQYSLPQLPYPMGYWNRRAGWLGGGVERRRVPRTPASVVRVTHVDLS